MFTVQGAALLLAPDPLNVHQLLLSDHSRNSVW